MVVFFIILNYSILSVPIIKSFGQLVRYLVISRKIKINKHHLHRDFTIDLITFLRGYPFYGSECDQVGKVL